MSSEKDFAPLSAACVRALNDKMYEKRKAAALEIEKMVKDFSSMNNTTGIRRLFKLLGQDFIASQNPNTRKGGTIGLAAMAIALGKDSSLYIDELVLPILHCFADSDSRVRYYACEALYNVIKVSRGFVLQHFNEVFRNLAILSADPDVSVKNGAELLDRLMKDIVTESASFDLVSFIPLLQEHIYTKNPFARQFVLSWVSVLHSVPDIDMIVFLPELIDGLFQMLGDHTQEIKKNCETILAEFLKCIQSSPSKVDFTGMTNVLIYHAQSKDELQQFTAITWLKEFVTLSGRVMLPFVSDILLAVLPCLAYKDAGHTSIREMAQDANFDLTRLITSDNSPCDDDDSPTSAESTEKILDLSAIVSVLTKNLEHHSKETRVAVLRWIYQLHIKIPNKMHEHVKSLFPLLLLTLSDKTDEVVLLSLEVLAEIASPLKDAPETPSSEQSTLYFDEFLVSLLQLFHTNHALLQSRGHFIIRHLCMLLSSESVYRTLADSLAKEKDLVFAGEMVKILNHLLLTACDLNGLREQLRELNTKENCKLFVCLYRAWCHNPACTIALCLLSQNYEHACDLIQSFSELEITVDFMTEVDRIVQLIESPIFTFLRLQLVQGPNSAYLVRALYGLLMLLPQTDTFQLLNNRLSCLPHHAFKTSDAAEAQENTRQCATEIHFPELLEYFNTTQANHKLSRNSLRQSQVMDKTIRKISLKESQ